MSLDRHASNDGQITPLVAVVHRSYVWLAERSFVATEEALRWRCSEQHMTSVPPHEPNPDEAVSKLAPSWRLLPMAAVTGIVLYLLVTRIAGADDTWVVVRNANWTYVAAGGLLVVVRVMIASYRFVVAIKSLGVKLPFARALDAVLATWPLTLVLPSRASDLLRGVAVRDVLPAAECSSCIVAEKLVDVQSLCLMTMVGSALMGVWAVFGMAATTLVMMWTITGLLVRHRERLTRLPGLRRIDRLVHRLFAAFTALRERRRIFAELSVVSLMAFLPAVGLAYTLAVGLGADVSFGQVAALWPLSIFVGMLPLTIGGFGTRDAAFLYLLSLAQSGAIDEAPVLAATLAYGLMTTVVPGIVGLVPMLRHMRQLAGTR